jgi:hypothetical protein
MSELAPTMLMFSSGREIPIRESQKIVQEKINAAAEDGQVFILVTAYESGEGFTVQWPNIEIVANAKRVAPIDQASGVPILRKG